MGWNWMTERSVICWKEHICCLFFPQNWDVQLSSCEVFVDHHRMNCSIITNTKKKMEMKNYSPVLPNVFGSVFLLLLCLVWMQDYGACFNFLIVIFFAFLQIIMLYISFTLFPSHFPFSLPLFSSQNECVVLPL